MEQLSLGDVALEHLLLADRDALNGELERSRIDSAGAVAKHQPDPAGKQAAERIVVERGELADRLDAGARRADLAFGPTPGSLRTASGARYAASRPAGTTVSPPGLRRSLATLATTLQDETPSEQVRPRRPRTAA